MSWFDHFLGVLFLMSIAYGFYSIHKWSSSCDRKMLRAIEEENKKYLAKRREAFVYLFGDILETSCKAPEDKTQLLESLNRLYNLIFDEPKN